MEGAPEAVLCLELLTGYSVCRLALKFFQILRETLRVLLLISNGVV
jgi:hypothetical protein